MRFRKLLVLGEMLQDTFNKISLLVDDIDCSHSHDVEFNTLTSLRSISVINSK